MIYSMCLRDLLEQYGIGNSVEQFAGSVLSTLKFQDFEILATNLHWI